MNLNPSTIIDIVEFMFKKSVAFLGIHLFSGENIETKLFKNNRYESIVERDLEQIEYILLDNNIEGITSQSICNFFKYPIIEDFIRKIYAPIQSFPLAFVDITKIYAEFNQLVVEYFCLQPNRPSSFSRKLFEILLEGSNETLTLLYNNRDIQSLNAFYNYQDVIKQYGRIQELYKALNNYRSVSGYLLREVCPAEAYDYDIYNYYRRSFSSGHIENIYQVVEKEKHITLLADAGMGKTTELKQIAYYYSRSNSPFYPILVSLNKYVAAERISEFFQDYWEFIPKKELLIILDGLDEIQSKDKMDIIRKIELFIEKYEDVHVIVSCRSNLYIIEYENNSGLLEGFKSYMLLELKKEEIERYVKNKLNSRSTKFFDSISLQGLSGLIRVPFYLNCLVELFGKQDSLPESKASIFDTLLESRIKLDFTHYRTTGKLDEEDKSKIIDNLGYIALSMECLGRNFIADEELKILIPDINSRELIQHSTAWKKVVEVDKTTWKFEHNNFQEYLAAKKMSALSTETIKHIVSFGPEYNKIIPSWTNTLSFLISISNNQDLLSWILNTNPKSCVYFDVSKVEKLKRIEIVKEIFNEYKSKRIWIYSGLFNYSELARFGKSEEIVDFLLNEAKNAVHYTTIGNSINLLSELEIPYTKNNELQDVLMKTILEDNGYPEIIKEEAIRCLSIHNFYSKENVYQITQVLSHSTSDRIRSGLYYLLCNSDYLDEYIDLFLDGINLALHRDILSSSEISFLLKGLHKTKSSESVSKILNYFIKYPDDLDHLYVRNVVDFINNCIDAYSEDPSILDTYLKLFGVLYFNYKKSYLNQLMKFFEITGTKGIAFKSIYFHRDEHEHAYSILAVLSDSTCIEFVIKEYEGKKIEINEMRMLQSFLLWENNEVGLEFNRLLNQKYREDFPLYQEEKHDDTEKREYKDIDLIFDKTLFIGEVKAIFEVVAKKELTRSELLDIKHQGTHYSALVIHTLWQIASKEKVSLEKALKCIDNLKWDLFYIENIYDMLGRNKEINLSTEHKKFISNWCFSNLGSVNFKQAISVTDRGISANQTAIYLWYFYRKFKIEYPKKVLLDMISFDWEEGNRSVGIEYLENELDYEEMKKRVLENLHEGIKCDFILRNHIKYCKKYKIKDVLKYALEIIVDAKRSDETRQLVLDTTIELSETLSELAHILLTINDAFKWNVVKELINRNYDQCDAFLLDTLDNATEEDKLKAAQYLTTKQNLKGLEFLVVWTKEHNKYPSHFIESPIKRLYVSESIPYLFDLLKLSYKDDFIQDRFNHLRGDIWEAFSNIALNSDGNLLKIKSCIEKFISENSSVSDSVNYLHSDLENLEFKFYMSKNETTNVDSVIKKLKDHGVNQ